MKVCDLDTGFSGQFAVVSPLAKEGVVVPRPKESQVSHDTEAKAKKSKKKRTSKEKKAAEVESLKAAKTRVIESPPKELLVDLDSDSPPPSSAARVVRPEKTQRATSKSVKVEVDNEKEEDEEEEPFFIKEDNDEEDEDFCSGAVAAVDP